MGSKTDQLEKRLKEISLDLQRLQKQFFDIKQQAKGVVVKSSKKRDERKILEIKKKLKI